MHWLQFHPDDLIERFEPAEALALLRQQAVVAPDHLTQLDVYLHHWTLVLLQRTNDPEGVQEMLTFCEVACDLLPVGNEGSTFRNRWSAFEDLLEGKRRTLQAGRHAPPIQLKQQDTILQIIELADSGRVKQQELAERLHLSKGRVSQILGVLESRALISRQRQGKESWISRALNPSAPATPIQRKAIAPASAAAQIGANVFAIRKAA